MDNVLFVNSMAFLIGLVVGIVPMMAFRIGTRTWAEGVSPQQTAHLIDSLRFPFAPLLGTLIKRDLYHPPRLALAFTLVRSLLILAFCFTIHIGLFIEEGLTSGGLLSLGFALVLVLALVGTWRMGASLQPRPRRRPLPRLR